MILLLNILWILFGGDIILFLEYITGGLILCLTIVGIPFGMQCFKIAFFIIAPFGSEVTHAKSSDGCFELCFNIIWILFGGLWIAITHLVLACAYAITIIGIPFALQHFKLASLAIAPFGKKIK